MTTTTTQVYISGPRLPNIGMNTYFEEVENHPRMELVYDWRSDLVGHSQYMLEEQSQKMVNGVKKCESLVAIFIPYPSTYRHTFAEIAMALALKKKVFIIDASNSRLYYNVRGNRLYYNFPLFYHPKIRQIKHVYEILNVEFNRINV
ncbi:MAG: hypothetical protein ACFE8N_10940 [Promethearchaeota archaeon]